jgi:hypothetical protein
MEVTCLSHVIGVHRFSSSCVVQVTSILMKALWEWMGLVGPSLSGDHGRSFRVTYLNRWWLCHTQLNRSLRCNRWGHFSLISLHISRHLMTTTSLWVPSSVYPDSSSIHILQGYLVKRLVYSDYAKKWQRSVPPVDELVMTRDILLTSVWLNNPQLPHESNHGKLWETQ